MSYCSSSARRRFVQHAAGASAAAAGLLPLGARSSSPSTAARPPEWVYVLNSRDASVSLIDKAARTESRRITVGKEPHHLYPTPDGRSLIVGNAMSDDLVFFDPVTADIQRRIPSIDDPYQLGFSPDTRWFVTAALRLDRVDIYRHERGELKLEKRLSIPKAPSHIWFSADSSMVFATLQDSNEIVAISLQKLEPVWKLRTGKQPAGIVITPDDRHLLVGVMGENFVDVIDWRAQKSIRRIVTGRGAHNLRGLGDQRHVFVTNRVDNSVSCIDMRTFQVVSSFPVPGGPDCMEITSDRKIMWITNRFARQVSLVDLADGRIIHTIGVGRSPHGIFFTDRAPLI
ncbi:MAG: YncE family protein [Betaproteobacteria bacterium]